MKESVPENVTELLGEDEKPLWMMRQRRYINNARAACLLVGFVFMVLPVVVWGCARVSLTVGTLAMFAVGWLGLLSLCAWGYVSRGRKMERTLFVLTDQRVLLIDEPRRSGGQMVVWVKPISPMLVSKVRRHRNGSVDYIFAEEKTGRVTQELGFMRVPPEQNPEMLLAELGATLPERKEKRKLHTIECPRATAWGVVGYLLVVCGLVWVLSRMVESEGAYLFFTGEKTEALVVDFEQVQEKKGRRRKREVTVNYPVLAFRTTTGIPCVALSLYGYEEPPFGKNDKVQIFYDAANPTRATMDDESVLIAPGIILAFLLWWGWSCYRYIALWRVLRRTDVLYVDMSGDGAGSTPQQTAGNAAQKA